jgi:S-(hydroxymethyl)glutathione dehydrogenase/alcohol dehydrogenase
LQPGSTVAVFGAGGVELNVIQGARLVGADSIIAIGVIPSKLAHAHVLGATHVTNAAEADTVASVCELTKDVGVDYSFEAVGRPETGMTLVSQQVIRSFL